MGREEAFPPCNEICTVYSLTIALALFSFVGSLQAVRAHRSGGCPRPVSSYRAVVFQKEEIEDRVGQWFLVYEWPAVTLLQYTSMNFKTDLIIFQYVFFSSQSFFSYPYSPPG